MSLERIIKILKNLGFSKTDAEVYVYLAKTGPKDDRELTIGLRIAKRQLSQILSHLKEKGAVSNSPDHPAMFSALDFEELLKLYIKLNQQQARSIQETKEEILESWKNIDPYNND